ncbi:MAG: membrane integrity-associated transporter subunit PqiC [Hyphomicrobiales bacterium]|nr:membrane integrity-associated transporter subunit PqiC [Hyphomicrobiales bacterium]
METRARYVLIGIFLLVLTAGVFGFIYWLENSGGFRERENYRVRFDGPVSGLLTGSSVLFNGIRVGEVTGLGIRADAPRQVTADIAVDGATPIRQDTVVDIEYQGLTGIAAIALNGGDSDAPMLERNGDAPVLNARQGAGLTMTQSAREALLKIHGILDDNAESFKEMLSNINEFAGALARNSNRVDGILGGLDRMTGGARGKDTEKVYDLIAAKNVDVKTTALRGQVSVPPPTAVFNMDTQNILFLPEKDAAPEPPGPRWADTLTRLVQSKVSQSFENSGLGASVGHNDALIGDYQLLIDIRNFQTIAKPEPMAEVELFVKIVDLDGKIHSAQQFMAETPAKSTETTDAVVALRDAFGQVAAELVTWTATSLKPELEPTAAPGTQAPAADAGASSNLSDTQIQ